jgi:16S rRNA (cytidine1402-2'-O)-methyltransferase
MSPDQESSGCLFIVATPIGNLGDLSQRAALTIENSDIIACEDTRVTAKLLQHLNLQIPMVSYREENERKKSQEIALDIESGKKVALLSDAGYPCINDPGFRLVRECHARKLRIIPIPGPNAALTALAASGLPTHQFAFIGFLPKKTGQVQKTIESWKDFDGSVVLYESKYKIAKTLNVISETLGSDRFICLARELTKSYESILSGPASQVIEEQSQSSGKGEFTIVIGPSGYSFK